MENLNHCTHNYEFLNQELHPKLIDMKKKILISIVIAAFFSGYMQLAGCTSKDKNDGRNLEGTITDNLEDEKDGKYYNAPVSEAIDQSNKEKDISVKGANTQTITSTSSTGTEKIDVKKEPDTKIPSKIIKTADISFQIKDIKDARTKIIAIVRKSGAYISTENQATNSYSITNDMTIRIKPESFDDLVDKLMELSIYTDYRKITSQDVTADYVDTEARLKSKTEVETRYTEILKKAVTIYDILQVEEKLNQIHEEIDAAKGKLKYMNDEVTYSTINLHFYEKLDYQPAPESGFFYKFGKAFSGGWQALQMFFIGVIYLWPLWIIAAIVVYLVLWFIKRGKRKRQQKH